MGSRWGREEDGSEPKRVCSSPSRNKGRGFCNLTTESTPQECKKERNSLCGKRAGGRSMDPAEHIDLRAIISIYIRLGKPGPDDYDGPRIDSKEKKWSGKKTTKKKNDKGGADGLEHRFMSQEKMIKKPPVPEIRKAEFGSVKLPRRLRP